MAKVYIYDENDATVPNRITGYVPSANTPDYSGRDDVLINPDDAAAVLPVNQRVAVPGTNSVRDMTAQEQSDVADAEIAATAAQARVDAKAYEGMVGDRLRFRALIEILIDEFNILRALHSLPDRTVQQLKTAIDNKIDSGDAD